MNPVMFWSLLVGFLAGAFCTLFVLALCMASGRENDTQKQALFPRSPDPLL